MTSSTDWYFAVYRPGAEATKRTSESERSRTWSEPALAPSGVIDTMRSGPDGDRSLANGRTEICSPTCPKAKSSRATTLDWAATVTISCPVASAPKSSATV